MTRKLNDYRIAVDPDTLCTALVLMAQEYAAVTCQVEECEVCLSFEREWEDLFLSLDETRRLDVVGCMRGRGIISPLSYRADN